MMRLILFISLTFALVACKSEETKVDSNTTEQDTAGIEQDTTTTVDPVADKLELVEVEGDIFTEYYPGKKNIKFQGPQDEEGKRHGKWLYFSEQGEELSMTMYDHGNKHGHIMVKHPNGAINYTGEFQNNVPVGIWKTYSITGKKLTEKDYGYPE